MSLDEQQQQQKQQMAKRTKSRNRHWRLEEMDIKQSGNEMRMLRGPEQRVKRSSTGVKRKGGRKKSKDIRFHGSTDEQTREREIESGHGRETTERTRRGRRPGRGRHGKGRGRKDREVGKEGPVEVATNGTA